ncbi:unnamed protein product [Euphydryas editha]|uniref:Uncharacterized protein n=1 Tax=Euphydryas editha TaxID=104508 RepID=A0AAU9VFU7_EUPED|nr:unnamed protein product [Euphydryas editha]
MLYLILFVLAASEIKPAYVSDTPSLADRLDRLYEKLEKITVAPSKKFNEKLYAKLDRLNSLTPAELSDDDEELLSAMQLWGSMSDDQLRGVVQEMQRMKEDEKSERLTYEYSDSDWNDDVSYFIFLICIARDFFVDLSVIINKTGEPFARNTSNILL